MSASMKAKSNCAASGSARRLSAAGPSRSSMRSETPAFAQYRRATLVHSSLTSRQSSRPPGASPRAIESAE